MSRVRIEKNDTDPKSRLTSFDREGFEEFVQKKLPEGTVTVVAIFGDSDSFTSAAKAAAAAHNGSGFVAIMLGVEGTESLIEHLQSMLDKHKKKLG